MVAQVIEDVHGVKTVGEADWANPDVWADDRLNAPQGSTPSPNPNVAPSADLTMQADVQAQLGLPDVQLFGEGIGQLFEWPWNRKKKKEEPPPPKVEESYVGIGVGLQEDPASWGKEQVVPLRLGAVGKGTPAEKAGLQVGDVITKIDGRNVVGLTGDELANLVIGNEGTKVAITISRQGTEKTVDVTRAKVNANLDTGGSRSGTVNGGGIFDLLRQLGLPIDPETGSLVRRDQSPNGCPANPDYITIIDTAANNMYEPEKLGDLNSLRHKYNCEIKTQEDAIKYADKALSITQDKYNRIVVSDGGPGAAPGKEAGIGAAVGRGQDGEGKPIVTGPVKINDVVPGSPAERAGVRPGDAITHVNGSDISKLPLDEVINLVRGKSGTSVELTITRDGKPLNFTINREKVQPVAVADKDLGDGVAYIRLYGFEDEKTVQAVSQALSKHSNAESYVFDLRNNPGGRVDVVLEIMSMFVKEGKLLRMYGRHTSDPSAPAYMEAEYGVDAKGMWQGKSNGGTGKPEYTNMQRQPYMINGKPVVVLVNENSASASEVFAGAIKDNKAATVVGTTTYGKGIGQSYIQLAPDVTLSVTSLRYTSPHGHWPGDANDDKRGVTPDVVVKNAETASIGGPDDKQLQTALEILKKKKQPSEGVRVSMS